MNNLTAVSLFAGIGGVDFALQRADVRVVAAVEIDPAARGVLADRFPDVALFNDVREVTSDQLRDAGFVPERGIITAGWPCQGNSVAGRRGGMGDARSGLWSHVVRLLAETRAAWFFGENVPGLLSVNDGRDFATVLGDLAGIGVECAWRVLDAQHFGVPQRRRRVIIVGHFGDRVGPVQILFEPESGGRDSAASGSARPGAALGTINGVDERSVAYALTAREAKGPDSNATTNLVVSTLQASMGTSGTTDAEGAAGGHLIPFMLAENQRGEFLLTDKAALTSGGGKPGQGYPCVVQPLLEIGARTGTSTDDPRAGIGIGEPGDPMFTLQSSKQHAVSISGNRTHTLTADGHDASEDGTGRGTPIVTAVRRLTPTECERLQGFPDGWTATSNGRRQADSARYKQLGNAVAVPCIEWVTRRLIDWAVA